MVYCSRTCKKKLNYTTFYEDDVKNLKVKFNFITEKSTL